MESKKSGAKFEIALVKFSQRLPTWSKASSFALMPDIKTINVSFC